jgi:hypothetical protein
VDKDPDSVKHFVTPIALTAALALANPAWAAPVAADPPATGKARILSPLTLSKTDDLHFGTIIPTNVSATVTVPANGGVATTTGGLTLVATDPTVRARFDGEGVPGRRVYITLPSTPFPLNHGLGDTVTVMVLTLDGQSRRDIDVNGDFSFHVGGILQVGANQSEGLYSADYDVTVEY